jgi:hypothetical protein
MKQPLEPLHSEFETEFSDGIYQAIVWLPEEDQEGGSVRLEIAKELA